MNNAKTSRNALMMTLMGVLLVSGGCDKITAWFDSLTAPKKPSSPVEVSKELTTSSTPTTQPQKTTSTPQTTTESSAPSGNVLVKVGDWTMTKEEFEADLKQAQEALPDLKVNVETKKAIVEELVRQQLLVQEAKRRGYDKDPQMQKAIENMANTLLMRRLIEDLTKDITVTDEEVQQFYEQNKDAFKTPEEYKVRMIVVDDEALAKQILVELYQGADFADKARQYSKDKSAWQGGDLGYLSEFPFEKMADAVKVLDKGAVSPVFKGPQGYYIVKLEDKRGGEPIAFDQVKDYLKSQIMLGKQQEAVMAFVEQLRQQIPVTVNEQLLEE
ncbi:MAG: peptidylprolyl isomerase [Phycisphaerae bacterium]|nr:MAG: peptidylprolyl isomerase [Phycisphaerae bacterium]